MTEDIGRNDPCPCGSGKKYKKCCLQPNRNHRDSHPPDNLSWKQKLNRFRSMPVHEQFAFLRDCYRDPDDVNGEYFLELMFALFRNTARQETHADFQNLIDQIHEHRSDLVDEYGVWLDRWRLMSLLWSDGSITDRDLQQLSESYGEDPDIMNPVLWAFLYRGRNDDLRIVLPDIVTRLRDRNDLMPGAYRMPGEKGVHVELYHDLNQSVELPEPEEWIETHRDRLEQYVDELHVQNLASFIRYVTGNVDETWSPADFVLSLPEDGSEPGSQGTQNEPKALPSEHRENYQSLGKQFLRYRHEQYGVPRSRTEMAVNDLILYLLRRADRKLGPKEGFLEAERREQRDEPAPKQKEIAPENLLLPDGDTLKRYFNRQDTFLQKHVYRQVALYTAIPEWLAFLEEHSLVTSEQVQDTMENLQFLKDLLIDSLQDEWPDPLLLDHLKHLSSTTSFQNEETDSDRSGWKMDETIRRRMEEIRTAEREMYHVEDDEFFDWERFEDPMQKLAEYGRNDNVRAVRDGFQDIIQNCNSGVAFAFAGQYSILTAPDEMKPVLEQLNSRIQDDLASIKDTFETVKNQQAPHPNFSTDQFWFYLHQFHPYLFQFLRQTDRSMSPEHIDHILNNLLPDYFDTFRNIRTYLLKQHSGPDEIVYFSFRSTLSSLPELLLTFYSALTGTIADQLDHPTQDRPGEENNRRELPEVPDDLLKWMQVRWNYHRPDEGDWTPDPIEGENPLKHIEKNWTFEL